jgi:hypothetical protein
MTLLAISGFIGSGKDTAANFFVDNFNYERDSFAATLKDIVAPLFGWERSLLEGDTPESREWRNTVDKWWSDKLGIPKFTPRKAMQLIGTDTLRDHFNPDMWLLTFERRFMESSNKNIIISDARFPNEMQHIRSLGGKIIRVKGKHPPEWEEIATLAVNGNEIAKAAMEEKYADVHFSEWAWLAVPTDHVITNTGTLDDLKQQVFSIAKIIS